MNKPVPKQFGYPGLQLSLSVYMKTPNFLFFFVDMTFLFKILQYEVIED